MGSRRLPPSIRPYFQETNDPTPQWRSEIARLVGFHCDEVHERLIAWLLTNGFASRDGVGNVRFKEVPEASTTSSTPAERRAIAVFATLRRLRSLEQMYAPERAAWMRWRRRLDRLEDELTNALAYATVRVREDGYFLGRCVGHARIAYSERMQASDAVRAAIQTLLSEVGTARSRIVRYRDDLLPGVQEEGRFRKTWLASAESDLQHAGFSYAQIARLTEAEPGRAGTQRVRQRVERHRRSRPASEEG